MLSLGYLDMSCRSRLATLNEKLTALERRIEYIEARVSVLHCIAKIFFSIIFELPTCNNVFSLQVTKGETLT